MCNNLVLKVLWDWNENENIIQLLINSPLAMIKLAVCLSGTLLEVLYITPKVIQSDLVGGYDWCNFTWSVDSDTGKRCFAQGSVFVGLYLVLKWKHIAYSGEVHAPQTITYQPKFLYVEAFRTLLACATCPLICPLMATPLSRPTFVFFGPYCQGSDITNQIH